MLFLLACFLILAPSAPLHPRTSFFNHNYAGFPCASRFRAPLSPSPASPSPASPSPGGRSPADPPLAILLPPLGAGVSSWVFEPLLSSALLPRHSLHAPDLLGTGSSAPFDPSSSGLFFPLDWARQVESLYASLNTTSPVALVSQGGVAPVALVLAARGKIPLEKLLLLSPPTLETLTAPVPQSKFALNYRLLTFPLWKPLVVSLLSFPPLVSFFADRVLLSSPSPPFVGECVSELRRSPHAAEPVFVFNAGGLFLRSYAPEMAAATCPVAIVSGEDDSRGRIEGRMGLPEAFERAESVSLETVQGFKNVMPYEAPEALAELIGG